MRNNAFDILKGFAIFLVVIGHLMQVSMLDYDHNILWRFIYSFHMPLFFFISGFLSFYSKTDGYDLILKRFNSLIIPFFIWSIIYFFCKDDFNLNFINYLIEIVKVPDKSLWFLWALFFCYLLLFVVKKTTKYIYISLAIISVLLLIFSIIVKDKIFGINLISKQFPFFIMGYLFNNYKDVLFQIINKFKIFILLIFIIAASFWMRKEDPLFYSYINLGPLFKLAYVFIVGVLGILSSLVLIINIKDSSNNYLQLILSFIGKHTFSIYAVHTLLVDYFKIDNSENLLYYVTVFIYALLLISISVLIEYLLSFSSFLLKICFGKKVFS